MPQDRQGNSCMQSAFQKSKKTRINSQEKHHQCYHYKTQQRHKGEHSNWHLNYWWLCALDWFQTPSYCAWIPSWMYLQEFVPSSACMINESKSLMICQSFTIDMPVTQYPWQISWSTPFMQWVLLWVRHNYNINQQMIRYFQLELFEWAAKDMSFSMEPTLN